MRGIFSIRSTQVNDKSLGRFCKQALFGTNRRIRWCVRWRSNSSRCSTPIKQLLLQIHPKILQRMDRRGAVVGVQVGKLWRFRASELNGWLARIAG